ncbi:hypothetical protein B0H34DRAFT_732377 [Crassisporium funariophilum]|nr:hypothetical protein B0H34DRAFT_732377 [Crassisporium funariophilum]
MVTKVGLAFFQAREEWAVVLSVGNYFSSQSWMYEIFVRRNMVWYRRDHNTMVSDEQGFRGMIHLGEINCDISVLHGRMQSVYSGEGRGHPNPTLVPWGPRAWVIRVLLIFQQEYGIQLPRCRTTELIDYIENRMGALSKNIIPLIPERE